MSKIRYGTDYVLEDEYCLGLSEMNYQSPGNRGWHRYQKIFVVRNDQPAEFRMDMGPVENFKGCDQFSILGAKWPEGPNDKVEFVHTVGELREWAERMREERIDKRELVQKDNIISDW